MLDFLDLARVDSKFAILFLKWLKSASVLGPLGAGCGSLPSSGLAFLVPACVLGRLEAGCDDGISSSESELFLNGDLMMIDEIGGVWLSLISASMKMTELSSMVAIEF